MISWIGYTLIEIKRIERATPRFGVIFDALSARGHFRSSPNSPLKNVESSAFSVFLSSNSWGDRLVVSAVG
jgi:hypothetical protein